MADDNNQLIETLMGMLGDNPQEKINAVLSSLTNGAKADSESLSAEEHTPVETDLGAASSPSENANAMPDLSSLLKIQGLLSQSEGTSDDRTALLRSLKPFLSDTRKPHVDRALQLLKLSKLATLAKDMDLFKDFGL